MSGLLGAGEGGGDQTKELWFYLGVGGLWEASEGFEVREGGCPIVCTKGCRGADALEKSWAGNRRQAV